MSHPTYTLTFKDRILFLSQLVDQFRKSVSLSMEEDSLLDLAIEESKDIYDLLRKVNHGREELRRELALEYPEV